MYTMMRRGSITGGHYSQVAGFLHVSCSLEDDIMIRTPRVRQYLFLNDLFLIKDAAGLINPLKDVLGVRRLGLSNMNDVNEEKRCKR
jgi:hypothetical protein